MTRTAHPLLEVDPAVTGPADRTTLFTNAHVVTMNDAGTEHQAGWLLVGQGWIQAVGGGQ